MKEGRWDSQLWQTTAGGCNKIYLMSFIKGNLTKDHLKEFTEFFLTYALISLHFFLLKQQNCIFQKATSQSFLHIQDHRNTQ